MGSALKRFAQVGWLAGLSALLSACDLLLVASTQIPLPPCVNDDCNCSDFNSQVLAQEVLDAFPGDPYRLDSDGNGQACESLPPQAVPFDPPGVPSNSPHLLLGNPSNANNANPNNYLLERQQYALGYGRDRNLTRWVSWQLDAAWLGNTPRQDNFRPDGALPQGFYQVTPDDYRGSGYDRGHLVPSADRTANVKDNTATFLMTNIVPQAPEHNRGIWRALEEYERDLVYQYDRELYIIAGSYGTKETIGQRQKITVPSRLWKVIVVLDRPGSGLAGISEATQIIAVDIPNQNISDEDWRRYQTSIDSIELATGLDLLSNVPEAVQAAIESQTSQE
ncbi:DNA/RNA non-specific endonuclease [Pseudanabaena sp. FACHB-2040]|uniref:DNA/RNA non-specific endonuclease n=1 Tax=Pseudanabaena sp. FACHB-2040 TaxID=2692859 RepID=UPI001685B41D|nr:DNA/RNA non-specific endonuclease [Pseudanabaena sp. FACHB-2040]MBD2256994.1 DNA/RNA non-specific endonuclease [Pseudanabaena sp. FACHB-2040]